MRGTLLLIGVLMEWVIVPLLGLCLVHALMNMRLLRRLRPSRVASKGASGDSISDVSVLIPARNEEARIRECLASLASQ